MMSDENQAGRHEESVSRLEALQPEYIESINVLKGEAAIEKYGARGAEGVLEIRTHQDIDSYNRALRALGMEPVDPSDFPQPGDEPQEDYYVVVREMPELIGGLQSIQQNVRYPEMARRAGIEGRVYIQFIVNEQGDVENAQVIRGIGGGADEEALRVVNEAKFRPGMHRGEPVRVLYSLPINFRMASNDPNDQIDMSEVRSRNNDPDRDPSVMPEFVVIAYPPLPDESNRNISSHAGYDYLNQAAELFDERNNTLDNEEAYSLDKAAREKLLIAKNEFEQAVNREPSNSDYWKVLFRIYATLGMDDEAENAREKSGLN
jgi:TonB family protein